MWNDGHDAYLESRVLSAEPVELVNLLYQACIASVREARRRLAEGDIAARSASVNRVCVILSELTGALDHNRGGELSRRLESLYDYIYRRVVEAHFQQTDAPLAEVLGLLATLAEGWESLPRSTEPVRTAAECWAPPVSLDEPVASHAWSF